jgi:hypothetical protein
MKYIMYVLLQVWFLFWGAVFVWSLVQRNANPLALVLCIVGMLLWARFVNKDGKLWG